MAAALVLGEIALLSVAVCLAHRLKDRLGLAPLYMLVGLYEAFLFVANKASVPITISLVGVRPRGIYLMFLAAMWCAVVLVYVLEGTRAARRMILAIALLYLVHGAIDVLVEYHAAHPPPGKPAQPGIDLVWYSTPTRLASMAAMMVDFVVLIVVYQSLVNRLPRLPLMVPLLLAVACAFVADAAVFKVLRHGQLSWSIFYVGAKVQAGVAAAVPVAIYFSRQIRRSGAEVRQGLLQRGALELVDLRRQVQEMQRKLRESRAQYVLIKDTFSRYVSADVVAQIIADPSKVRLGGEKREVTILFADIRGYSTLSEAMDASEIITLLNIYFRRVSAVILRHDGMINEFEGDAVLAVFGAPLDLPGHAVSAVEAALGMLDAVEALNRDWEADGTLARWRAAGVDGLAIRIGVHSGPVVAGNIGSEVRTKYAVIGDTVNISSRVEGLNKELKTSLLVTRATVAAMGDHPLARRAVDRGSHTVKGRSEPVQVFTVGPP